LVVHEIRYKKEIQFYLGLLNYLDTVVVGFWRNLSVALFESEKGGRKVICVNLMSPENADN
jgi:hypothetical protein